jgi:hypothetical protein
VVLVTVGVLTALIVTPSEAESEEVDVAAIWVCTADAELPAMILVATIKDDDCRLRIAAEPSRRPDEMTAMVIWDSSMRTRSARRTRRSVGSCFWRCGHQTRMAFQCPRAASTPKTV